MSGSKSRNPTQGPDSASRMDTGFSGTIFGGNNVGVNYGSVTFNPTDTVVDLLKPQFVADALFNSGKRKEEHAVTCQPETRTRILQEVRQWADAGRHSVCWLSGAAGTGKSTIAHTIAEEYLDKSQLAATFFFSRNKGDREDINKLVPTLAFQIAHGIPSFQARMKQILQDNALLSQLQVFKHIAEAHMNEASNKSLVVIDGLDECASRVGIEELIKSLGEMTNTRLRFLLTSRPERDIQYAFENLKGNITLSLSLQDSVEDIRTYLRCELSQIRQKFGLASPWPSELELRSMVVKSEGLFIYAATAVRYIGSGQGSPKTRLQTILETHKGVDPLYTQVITEAKESDSFDIVMGSVMYLRYPLAINDLSKLLGLDVSDIRMALYRCHSILVIPPGDHEEIRPYHASLRDFLANKERSLGLFRAPVTDHATLMIQCLRAITNAFKDGNSAPHYAFIEWNYHASSLLSKADASQGLGTWQSEAEVLFQQINLRWVKYWMVEALCRGTLRYVKVDLPSSRDVPKAPWARQMMMKLTKIDRILNAVSRRACCS